MFSAPAWSPIAAALRARSNRSWRPGPEVDNFSLMSRILHPTARQGLWLLALYLLTLGVPGSGLAAPSTTSATCTPAEQAQYQVSAVTYAKRIPRDRAHYFKAHKSSKLRAVFVSKQKAKLSALQAQAACQVVVPPPPIDLNPAPAANENFAFGPGMSNGQSEIKGDIAFAAEDEKRLTGATLDKVTVFASTNPQWLAEQECQFAGHNDDGCLQSVRQRWESKSATAVGGTGMIAFDWSNVNWSYGAGQNQKILAHELFHVLQYQLDRLVNNGATPSNQVRASGPVWLDEGSAEMVGYHVAADRRLLSYQSALADQIDRAKQISTPLSSLQTYAEQNIPNVYSLFHIAADHLVTVAPGGIPALATYYAAIGNGVAWPDAFKQAFGMSVQEYYDNFAAYRAKL